MLGNFQLLNILTLHNLEGVQVMMGAVAFTPYAEIVQFVFSALS